MINTDVVGAVIVGALALAGACVIAIGLWQFIVRMNRFK